MVPTNRDEASISMIEYILISGILMIILVITIISLNSVIIENPINQTVRITIYRYRKWDKYPNC